ncbi:zinc finger protein 704-like isoform X1 [Branchiostoma floridae x Branchiostoma belcheri]
MLVGKRIAKRSIVGSRVCVAGKDGYLHPGVIRATKSDSAGPGDATAYSVALDTGEIVELTEEKLVGCGFRGMGGLRLEPGQRVFLTHHGREVAGSVTEHQTEKLAVIVQLADRDQATGRPVVVQRRVEDLRLLESRKSARLVDHQDRDFAKLADPAPQNDRKRGVSHNIDVPKKDRKTSEEFDMDECMAAMILTSLSCSPVCRQASDDSSVSSGTSGEKPPMSPQHWPEGLLSSSLNSSSGASSISTLSMRSSPSPPHKPPTPPAEHNTPSTMFGTPPVDEGIDLGESHDFFLEGRSPRKRKSSVKTLFKCTWPGCGKTLSTCSGIERHVRSAHLGPKDSGDDGDCSDHEEEFYYTEIEVSVDTVADTFANMCAASPPLRQLSPPPVHTPVHAVEMARPPHEDHMYFQLPPTGKVVQAVITSQGAAAPMTIPVPPASAFSWQQSNSLPSSPVLPISPTPISPPFRQRSNSASARQQQHQAMSPKTAGSTPFPRKMRSEGKKCRKVYGMENRDLWCTQCRWKKACSRFLD